MKVSVTQHILFGNGLGGRMGMNGRTLGSKNDLPAATGSSDIPCCCFYLSLVSLGETSACAQLPPVAALVMREGLSFPNGSRWVLVV